MGGGLSKDHVQINEDEFNKKYQSILQNFLVERKTSDKIFGNITIYLYKKQDKMFRVSEVVHSYPNEASMDEAFNRYFQIMETSPSFILQLHGCRKQVEDSLCSLSYKVYALFDYVTGTLEDKIQERLKAKHQFRNEELWSLFEQLVSGLSIIQKHEYIRTDTIFIVNQINDATLYKIFYKQALNQRSNYEDCQKGITNGRYLSIDALKSLKEQQATYSDFEQSDKFALGMVLLSAALLENLDSCYDYSHYEFKHQVLIEKLNIMKQSYSQDLCIMVQQLLFNEDQLSLEQLNLNLSSFQLPCGPRIQDSYQGVKLENLPPVQDNGLPAGVQNNQVNNSFHQMQSNNIGVAALNQSLNNIPGNFIGTNDMHYHQDSNQLYNNSPKNNLQNGSQQYNNNTGNFNQFSQLQLGGQHSISNQNQNQDINGHNNLLQSIIHNPYNNPALSSPPQANNIFNSPLANTVNLNHQNSQQQGMANQYLQQSQGNNIFNANANSINHQPVMGAMNGGVANYNQNNNLYPQLQLNNGVMPLQNGMGMGGGQMNMNVDQNTLLLQLMIQMQQIQQTQQQQLQESFYNNNNNTSQMNYSPLRGANIFNQFNQKKQFFNDNQSEQLSKSFSAINNIPRRKTTMQYDDGSFYDGEMVLEYRDGYGQLVFSNKGVYEGTWKMNKMHGKGTLYYPSGDVAYEGDWFEDQFNNFGHLYNAKAQQTKQKFDFKDFTLIKNYWLKYEGEFTLDRKQGFGTLYFTNGERYSGNFKNDTVTGYGVYHQLDGDSFSGYWEDNLLIKRM